MRTATGSGGGAAAETGGDGGSVQQDREAEVSAGKRGRGWRRCIGGRRGRRRRGEAEEGRQGNGGERLQQLVMLAVFAKTAHQFNRDAWKQGEG